MTETDGINYGFEQSLAVLEGGTFSFTVMLSKAYDNSQITVKANGNELTKTEGVYTLSNITTNTFVTVEGVTRNTYSISLTETDNVMYGGYQGLTVQEGSSFTFEVALDEAYNNSRITVKANDLVVELVDNKYTVYNITENITITVEGVVEDTYTVMLTSIDHVTYSRQNATVTEGESFSFSITLSEPYNNTKPIVRANGMALIDINNIYTISNIQENKVVTIEGVTEDKYEVTLIGVYGLTYIYDSLIVIEGEKFEFTLKLAENYNNSVLTVKVDGIIINEVNGKYTISNITKDVTVSVEGVTLDVYSVTLTPTAGVEYNYAGGTIIDEGGSFEFTITLDPSYNNSQFTVKVNDVAIASDAGVYTISDIYENITITVEDVTKDTYAVTLTETSGVLYDGYENTNVLEDDDFCFTVTILDTYDNSTPIVKVDGVVITPDEYGVYYIYNIISNRTVIVEGVVADTYTITLDETDYVTYGDYQSLSVLETYDFSFTITLDEYYNNSEIVVKVNGWEIITPVNGIYTIPYITEDKTVTVEGVVADTYTITLTSSDYATYGNYGDLTVFEGDDFVFTVTPSMGLSIYDNLDGITANGITLIPLSAGNYAISNITANQTIAALGIGTSGLVYIGKNLSKGVNVSNVIVPSGTEIILSAAFYNMLNVQNIAFPDSIMDIKTGAFDGTAWYNSQLNGVVYAGKVAYRYRGTMPVNYEMTLNEGTIAIASEAFKGQGNLGKVNLPDSLIRINYRAFNFSGITSINIPDGVTKIDDVVFENCIKLTTVTFTENSKLTTIGNNAFSSTALTSFSIPSSVNYIASYAFYNCQQLGDLYIPDNDFEYVGTVPFYNTLWYSNQPDGVIYIGKALNDYKGDMPVNTAIEVRQGTTSICDNAFQNFENLSSITLPSSIRTIGSSAFYNCSSLLSIIIPQGVTVIQADTFAGCYSLISVTIPNTVTKIEYYAFNYCSSLLSVTIPQSVIEIENSAFANCTALTELILPNNLEIIDNYAFQGCSLLEEIIIPESVVYVGENIFYDCTSLTIYCESVLPTEYWHDNWNMSYLPVVWGYGKTAVTYSFDSNGGSTVDDIQAVTLTMKPFPTREGYYFIGWYDNEYCLGAPIGQLFYSAINITLYAKWDTIRPETSGLMYTPNGDGTCSITGYDGDNDIVYIPEQKDGNTVTMIGEEAFRDNSVISRIYLPDSVKVIGYKAFKSCKNLTFIQMSANLECISSEAFMECSNLKSIFLPSTLIVIDQGAFHSCTSLSSVTFDGDMESLESGIQNGAFFNCSSLTSIVIPSGVKTIGYQAFAYCTNLTSVTLDEGMECLYESAFFGCSSLEEIIIPASLTTLQDNVFGLCFNLTIKCKSITQPLDWSWYWNNQRLPVIWGYGLPDITFSFDTNGGEIIGDITSRALFMLPQPTKEGAYFIGWYDNELLDGEMLSAPYYIIDGTTTTLYAAWSTTYSETAGLEYTLIEDTYWSVTGYSGTSNIVYVPAFYKELPDDNELPVLVIDENAFDSKEIIAIYIAEGIKTIGSYAFYGCWKLAYVSLPASLEYIGYCSFYKCDSLSIISLGSLVNNIEDYAFESCENLMEINVHPDNQFYKSVDGVLFNKVGTIIVQYPAGKTAKSYTVPNGVEIIGVGAFEASLLETVIMPLGISTISESAFYTCSWLKNVIFAQGTSILTEIGNYAFEYCSSLVNIVIPRSVTTIGDYVFDSCFSLERIYLPIEVINIGYSAFYYCENLTIYCEASSSLENWDSDWCTGIKEIRWSYTMPE